MAVASRNVRETKVSANLSLLVSFRTLLAKEKPERLARFRAETTDLAWHPYSIFLGSVCDNCWHTVGGMVYERS